MLLQCSGRTTSLCFLYAQGAGQHQAIQWCCGPTTALHQQTLTQGIYLLLSPLCSQKIQAWAVRGHAWSSGLQPWYWTSHKQHCPLHQMEETMQPIHPYGRRSIEVPNTKLHATPPALEEWARKHLQGHPSPILYSSPLPGHPQGRIRFPIQRNKRCLPMAAHHHQVHYHKSSTTGIPIQIPPTCFVLSCQLPLAPPWLWAPHCQTVHWPHPW